MKRYFFKKQNSILILSVILISFLSLVSCSNDEIIDESLESVSKKNSFEVNNTLFFTQSDGSILKVKNGVENNFYFLTSINTSKSINKNNDNEYRIENPSTGEFIDIININAENEYYTFDAVTSTGVQINNIIYHGDVYEVLDETLMKCPTCIAGGITVVITIIEAIDDSLLENCQQSMPTSCPEGESPYMNFEEGWFSTSCEVGCQ